MFVSGADSYWYAMLAMALLAWSLVIPVYRFAPSRGAISATRPKGIIGRTNRFNGTDVPGKWKTNVQAKQQAKQEEDALAW